MRVWEPLNNFTQPRRSVPVTPRVRKRRYVRHAAAPRGSDEVTRLDYAETGAPAGETEGEAANGGLPPSLGESLAPTLARTRVAIEEPRNTKHRAEFCLLHVVFFIFSVYCH